jgi:flagellar motor protein MotB
VALADRRAAPGAPAPAAAAQVRRDLARSTGQPLDAALRQRMERRVDSTPASVGLGYRGLEAAADRSAGNGEPRLGDRRAIDFSTVRLHADGHAASAARQLGARAFTIGEHVYADPTTLSADPAARDGLIAHELAHVAQQRQLRRTLIQPRLIATGDPNHIQRFIALASPAMEEQLQHDPATKTIAAVAPLRSPVAPPVFGIPLQSSVFFAAMHKIMDDPLQDAEAHFGVGQRNVGIGAFPLPENMTGPTEQRIDMDDIENIEAGAPGSGLGKIAHELSENYDAHRGRAEAGLDRFDSAHEVGVSAESDVTENTVGPGRRVASVDVPRQGYPRLRVQDFENYYLVFKITRNGADFTISDARHAPRVNVLTVTIDQYGPGSAMPTTGAAAIKTAAGAVAANPSATVRVEGFADTTGPTALNLISSGRRAEVVTAALIGAGVAEYRIHSVGLGDARPVAPNDTEPNRALNRRVVIIVDRPGP